MFSVGCELERAGACGRAGRGAVPAVARGERNARSRGALHGASRRGVTPKLQKRDTPMQNSVFAEGGEPVAPSAADHRGKVQKRFCADSLFEYQELRTLRFCAELRFLCPELREQTPSVSQQVCRVG